MRLLRRIHYWLRHREIERELAEEIDLHRALSGDAREMGNVTLAREDARAVWIWPWLQSVWQDLAYALRGLRREPGFTLVALLALGTAIGLNTSLFTVFNSVVLKPWDVKDPGRMVRVFTRSTQPVKGVDGLTGLSVAEFRFLAERTKSFSGLVVFKERWVHFGFEPVGAFSTVRSVAADHFRVLGLDLHLGRGFLPEEDRIEAPAAVIVLSYALWRDHFGSDPAILGKQIPVDTIPFTVVGVAPRSFGGLQEREDGWLPLAASVLFNPAARNSMVNPASCCERIGGRLADGVTRQQAAAELGVLSSQFRSTVGDPQGSRAPKGAAFVLTDATLLAGEADDMSRVTQLFVPMFLGVTLVVLLACANVGNLLVARAAARQREIEVRRALGAGRARIVRQLLTESMALALGAGAVGVLLAYRVPAFVLTQATNDLPPYRLTPDLRVLAYALGLALFACLSFGLAPALHGTRPGPAGSRLRLRSTLLAAQVALSVILLTGAGLMLEGVRRAANRDLGFVVRDVSETSFELPPRLGEARVREFRTRLLNDIPSLASGDPFALAARAPLGFRFVTEYRLPEEPPEHGRRVYREDVSPGYFDTLRIPLVAGRDFEAGDAGGNTIIVNQSLARRWAGAAVGKTIFVAGTAREIIGIAKDAYTVELSGIEPMVYEPFKYAQVPTVLVRSSSPRFAAAIEAEAASLEPGTRTQTRPLAERVEGQLAASRIGAQIAGVLGAFALALATVGMFGVFAYAVQQRTKEIGIRMALGARRAQVIRLVLTGSSRAVAIGFLAGFLGAAAASRLIAGYLYGVNPLDPRTYLLVAAVLAAAALAASYFPSQRAAKIDPLAALRHE